MKEVDATVKAYKRKFDARLRHIKVILMNYKESMPASEWQLLVTQTKICIKKYPEEFLGPELPGKKTTMGALDLVFEGFERDMHIRKVQSFHNGLYV